MTTEPSPRVSEKVYAYITQGEQLLVFRHVDAPEAGIQVPGGTVQPGESLPEAVLREAFEETGLADLEIVSALGDTWFDLAAYERAGEVHHRHVFHLRAAAPLPATWRHVERDPSDGGPPILFEFSWMPLAQAPDLLIAEMGALAHLIGLRPGRPGASGKLPNPGGQQ
jgi:8-oxo-dGTP pyrophosphatase MutT (NUDIX family)